MAIYQIELTNHCNSACTWCNHSTMKREKGFMSWETFKQTIAYLQKEPPPGGVVGIHHFGESLLHPNLKEFLEYMEEKNIQWRLSTNGRLLKNKDIRAMLLKFSGLLVISLENGADIQDVNEFIKEKSKCESKLKLMLQTFGTTDLSSIIPGDYETVKIDMHSWGKNGQGNYRRCSFLAEDWACVLWDGTIVSCCFDMEGECKLGNVNSNRIRNHTWRACKTCEVVLQSRKLYNGN